MHLSSEATEEARSHSGVSILFLKHERDVVERGISQSYTRCVSASSDDADGWLATNLGGNHPPGARRASNSFPVLPRA